ncbi:hypothetical protein [Salinibacterium sp. ZJ450]|uniref:hypothetical protein n=1 Tax=Salinibacterium sp. ZJ450 TaxID=2708338 RepID=UPI001423B262|nr:hypothetical protein [Salinibacterium sp. ZJ450]
MSSSAGSFSFTVDALGATALLTDSAEAKAATYAYDAWGTITMTGAQAANNKWEYAGGDHDAATESAKLGARHSNPVMGRFTRVDTQQARPAPIPIRGLQSQQRRNCSHGLGIPVATIGAAFALAGIAYGAVAVTGGLI